jgi:hypothetical protein
VSFFQAGLQFVADLAVDGILRIDEVLQVVGSASIATILLHDQEQVLVGVGGLLGYFMLRATLSNTSDCEPSIVIRPRIEGSSIA